MATQHADLVTSVRVTFARIGRRRDVAPLDIDSTDPDVIKARIQTYARRILESEHVGLWIDMDLMRGIIQVGLLQSGGQFTIEHTSPEVWL